MRTLKKNQVVVFVIGIMIITAGYFSFANNSGNNLIATGAIIDSEEMASIGDARLVSANAVSDNTINTNEMQGFETGSNEVNINEINSNEINCNTLTDDEAGNEKVVSSNAITEEGTKSIDEYFANSKLERDTMYSEQIENYQDILSNTNVSEAQKKIAQEEITRINNEQNAIMISENIIKTKGIEDLIIFINKDSINVIVKGDELEKEEIAQIQNIITRELEADIANVHIMNKK